MNFATNFYSEYKFKKSTWFGFFEKYMVPHIADRIVLNTPISEIDQSENQVILTTGNGVEYSADKVLITVPIKVLQSNMINFTPSLPTAKMDAINSISMGAGMKAFIEFEKKFYADITIEGKLFEAISTDDKVYYDAAFRKGSEMNVLGLFSINEKAERFTSLENDEQIIAAIISELDEMYSGQASQHYKNHIIQNWSNEPYILGSYSYDFNGSQSQIVETILQPVDNKIYFAGEALSIDSQATVHGACASGMDVAEMIINQ
ncbi:MAG: NAD(P)/FAD-dependent oxidoreductase [Saprospiraceae bacterium]|nr:NAD(P)/FAD-dependent oxidoreductase [Saprospiraceae bacterium]|tara:strand:+ start:214 stop:999 length:786 start_codon:yes stop_codon:yes gene_type:complete